MKSLQAWVERWGTFVCFRCWIALFVLLMCFEGLAHVVLARDGPESELIRQIVPPDRLASAVKEFRKAPAIFRWDNIGRAVLCSLLAIVGVLAIALGHSWYRGFGALSFASVGCSFVMYLVPQYLSGTRTFAELVPVTVVLVVSFAIVCGTGAKRPKAVT